MSQRWLTTVCLHCEKVSRRIKGFELIPAVIKTIETEQSDGKELKLAV
ncbi:MAG TPA: hypothetical protein QF468_00670 [Nitrospinota bacterium]|jgi:hypothetical protein|nr:hypothetical protein [Nitrospinota bacterium]|tara:strand:- start:12992 stop:13135 length:144 start_codon:yes stop_codon:yes gene_type:complete